MNDLIQTKEIQEYIFDSLLESTRREFLVDVELLPYTLKISIEGPLYSFIMLEFPTVNIDELIERKILPAIKLFDS